MTKIKLTESRATLQGCQRAGETVTMPDVQAKRLVERFQAEFADDSKRTAKVRKGSRFHPGAELESKKRKTNKPKKAKQSKVANNLALLELDEKTTDILIGADPDHGVPGFLTIGELDQWIKNNGDLTKKAGIGPQTRHKIETAVSAFIEESESDDDDDDDLSFDDDPEDEYDDDFDDDDEFDEEEE